MPIRTVSLPLLLALSLAGGCATPSGPAARDEALRKQVSREIARICALPEAQRQAEIDKVKAQEGIVLVCPKS